MTAGPLSKIFALAALWSGRSFGHRRLAVVLVVAILLTLGQPCSLLQAQSNDQPQIVKLELGFAGAYKMGFWTPLQVILRGGAQPLECTIQVTVPDGDGVPTRFSTPTNRPVVLLPGRETTVPLYAKIGQFTADIDVTLVVSGQAAAKRSFSAMQGDVSTPLNHYRTLIVGWGARPLFPLTESDDPGDRTPVYRDLHQTQAIPTRWFGYDAAYMVYLGGSDPSPYRELSAESAQLEALDRWVRLGGKLLIAVGSKSGELLSADSPLARFLPGKFVEMVPLRQASAWETFAETNERLETATNAEGQFRLDVPRLEQVRGKIEAYEGAQPGDLPLVVRSAYGLGEVIFVAADLDQPPFVKWNGRNRLLEKLLGLPKRDDAETEDGETQIVNTFGFDDLSGQLRSALEQFQGVQLVPFSLVATLIVLYILAIGPVDYFLLKRGFKRMEWTWITFPATVVAFSLTAYLLAYALKGNQLRVNQVEVLDYDADSQLVRGTVWSNIFSPQVDAYDITYSPKPLDNAKLADEQLLVSWLGLPGSGFGGMHSQAGGGGLFRNSYAFSPALDQLIRMPIAVWSTKAVSGRWHGQTDVPLAAELVDRGDGLLGGNLTSRLDHSLTNCVLVYGRWAYPIGTLEPRARIAVEGKLDPQTVETYFKRVTLFHEKDAVNTFDPNTQEVDRIVEAMMLYDLLGGQSYVKLFNHYQRFLDLSSALNAGRAIVLGQTDQQGSTLLRGKDQPLASDGDRRYTFVRVVLPVQQVRE